MIYDLKRSVDLWWLFDPVPPSSVDDSTSPHGLRPMSWSEHRINPKWCYFSISQESWSRSRPSFLNTKCFSIVMGLRNGKKCVFYIIQLETVGSLSLSLSPELWLVLIRTIGPHQSLKRHPSAGAWDFVPFSGWLIVSILFISRSSPPLSPLSCSSPLVATFGTKSSMVSRLGLQLSYW